MKSPEKFSFFSSISSSVSFKGKQRHGILCAITPDVGGGGGGRGNGKLEVRKGARSEEGEIVS